MNITREEELGHTNTDKLKTRIDAAIARYLSWESTRDELRKDQEAAFHEFYASCGEDWPKMFPRLSRNITRLP